MSYAAAISLLLLPLGSCTEPYDDSELWGEVEQIKSDLAELKALLEEEIESLKELLAGKINVVNVERRTDGSTVVTLSDESSFTIYPKGAEVPSDLVTVVQGGDGELYWATYNEVGEAELIMVDGKAVPVTAESPEIRVNDDRSIEISFDGGESWIVTGYEESAADSLIADVEVVYSEWQVDSDGNPVALYCLLTLADGTEIKVGMNSLLIMDYDSIYVSAGSKSELVICAEDVADYMLTLPKGWECNVERNANAGSFTLEFSAPTIDMIKSGEGVGEGVAKFVAIFNNGLSAIASIAVSTTPVYVDFVMDNIVVTVGGGIKSLVCGLEEVASFSADGAAANANKYLADNTSKAAYGVTFDKKTSVTIKATDLRSDLSLDKEYIFWYAIPDAKNSVTAESIVTESYSCNVPLFSVTKANFFDAEIKFDVKGSNGYLLGYEPKASFNVNDVIEGYLESKADGVTLMEETSYSGSFVSLFGSATSSLEHGTEYVAWYLECGGLESVTVDNVVTWEFATKSFAKGGDLEVTLSDEEVGYNDISVKLNTSGHLYMYYAFLESNEVSGYPTDELKLDYLVSDGEAILSSSAVTAKLSGAATGSKYTLIAVAVDKDGKYGKVLTREFTTMKVEYNALSPKLSLDGSPYVTRVAVKVDCEGAASYKYAFAESSSSLWKRVLGGTVAKAGEYIITHPYSSNVRSTADAKYALEDGCIVLGELTKDVEHILVLVAIDGDGVASRPTSISFTPTIDLGDVVGRTTQEWADSKPAISVELIGDRGNMYSFSWCVAPVEGYTAYSISIEPSKIHQLYNENGDIIPIETVTDLIAYIVTYGNCCEYSADGYTHSWKEYVDEDNDGRIDDEMKEFTEPCSGVYCEYRYGVRDSSAIYTTWKDAEGNYYEPLVIDATSHEEITDIGI